MGYIRTLSPLPRGVHYKSRLSDLHTAARDAFAESLGEFVRTTPNDLRCSLRILVWVRWFVVTAWPAQLPYRANFGYPTNAAHTLYAKSLLALNGDVPYRIQPKRLSTGRWAVALGAKDAVMITAGLAISDEFANNLFVPFHPALAMFAVAFTSFGLSFP